MGQFTVNPAEAVVKPGCKQQVSVVFRAEANRVWTATIGLDISERDHRDQPDGIPYELGGDSCIPGGLIEELSPGTPVRSLPASAVLLQQLTPGGACLWIVAAGIDSSNLASIFEEHVVLSHLDPFNPINCSFGLKDKVFNFGTLIAQLPELLAEPGAGLSPRDASGAAAKKAGRPGVSAKARASVAPAAAAPDVAAVMQAAPAKAAAKGQDAGSLLDDPAAVKANLKFINPKKVPCTVHFSIMPQNGIQPGTFRAWCWWWEGCHPSRVLICNQRVKWSGLALQALICCDPGQCAHSRNTERILACCTHTQV